MICIHIKTKSNRLGISATKKVRLRNGFDAFPCGYFTGYENGYKLMIEGASIGVTAIQEIMIVDPQGVPVAKDTEDIRDLQE